MNRVMLLAAIFVVTLTTFGSLELKAQEVTVRKSQAISGLVNPRIDVGVVFVDPDSKIELREVAFLKGDKLTAVHYFPNGKFDVTLFKSAVKTSNGEFFLDAPAGEWACLCTLGDSGFFPLLVKLGNAPQPPPKPDDPTPNDDIDNTMGLGKIAFENAPEHQATIKQYALIYLKASEFLVGRPSFKSVQTQTSVHRGNPDHDLFAWIQAEVSNVQCPDQATCQKWAECRAKISDALTKSQQSKPQGFTRDDWYRSYLEVSNALQKRVK